MTISSFQKASREQCRLLNKFLKTYPILDPGDHRLNGCEEITFTFALRNYQKREELSYILAGMQGNRTHFLVKRGNRRVSVFAPPYQSDTREIEPATELAKKILEYQNFLRMGSFARQRITG